MSEALGIRNQIYTIRGFKVMLDRDLAGLYGVTTGNLNLAVKRNIGRFPYDFMFQLSKDEWEALTLQFAILKDGRGQHRKYLPYAFTEQGVSMLSGILKSDIAVEINIKIMRAFVELRQTIAAQPEYELLKETVRRIESRMDTMEANNLVDNTLMSGKNIQLSRDVQRLCKMFDQFQDAHIVIKRPEEGLNNGWTCPNCGQRGVG